MVTTFTVITRHVIELGVTTIIQTVRSTPFIASLEAQELSISRHEQEKQLTCNYYYYYYYYYLLSHLCKVFKIIYLKETMFLEHKTSQLYCGYSCIPIRPIP